MDLFSRFKNHSQDTVKSDETNDTKNHAANHDRRFFYMVEDRFALKNGSQCVVVGNIHGTIRVDDAIYILSPHGTTTVTIVRGLEHYVNGAPETLKSAVDQTVSILLDMKKEDIELYSIITSIRPQAQIDVNEAVENPIVAGLLYETQKFGKQQDYFSWLIYCTAHGHYLMPVIMGQRPAANGDGTATFEKNSCISFPTLRSPNDPNKEIFPVFTDWTELYKWNAAPKGPEGKIETMILRFPDLAAMMVGDTFDGFVINPFSDNRFWFDRSLVEHIVSMEGYQKEFGDGKTSPQVEEVKVPKDTKVMLGVPAENEEVYRIREKLKAYGETHADIRKIALLLQMSEDEKKAYLVYMDVDPSSAKEHFQKIYETIRGDAADIREMLFVPKRQGDPYEKVAEERQAYVFQR